MLLHSHGTTSCFILLMLAFQLHCTRQLSALDDYLSVQAPAAKTASHLSDPWDLQRAQSSELLIQPSSRPSSSAQFHDRYLYGKKLSRSFMADRRTPSQRDFSVPSIDYDSWKPLDYGNPMRHDPTIYYVPPTLDIVRFRSGSIPPPPVLATVKNSGLLPAEGITTETKPVSWPIKPQNPSVLIIHTHQRSGHPQPIYGTPDVEFFHLKTSLENFDRRIDRLNPGSDGGLTLINAPHFGPRASSTSSNSIEPSSSKSWSQRPTRPLVHSTPEGQQVLPLYASPMHHVVHMAENRASQLSQADAPDLLFDPTGAGSSSQQNMSLPSPAGESPASTDYIIQHASEKGIGDPYSYVNKQNHLKVPFAIFNKGSLQEEPLLRPFPSPISLLQLQNQQQETPKKYPLHSESSGYVSVPNSSHNDSAENSFFPASEPLGSWLESQEVAEMKEAHALDKLSSSTSLLPSYERRINTERTNLVFRGPLEGSSSLNFVVKNTSTMLDRSGTLSTVPPRTDLPANDLVSDARRDRLPSPPIGVPVHAISQPVFVIRQGHSKVKTYGRSHTVLSKDQS